MNTRLKHITRSLPLFNWLLPLFFILHYITQYYDPFLVLPGLKLLFIYLVVATALFFIGKIIFHHTLKAGIFSFSLLCIQFFFGALHDFIRSVLPDFFLGKYIILIPLLALLIVILIIYLKKTSHRLERITQFFNLLLILIVVMDLVQLFPNLLKKQTNLSIPASMFLPCDTCIKPDIYLIVTDEYAGEKELADIFSFDNTSFYSQLKQRGFHVANHPTSNYNATVYSISSMLQLDYLDISGKKINHRDMMKCRRYINNNNTIDFLRKNGYSFSNNSFFDFAGIKNPLTNLYFPSREKLINAGTFLNRVNKDLGAYFAKKEKIESVKTNDLQNDRDAEKRLIELVSKKEKQPKFVYTHFTVPHHPYFLDSSGKETPYEYDDETSIKTGYLQYLKYANQKFVQLIDLIKSRTGKPAVIILMSDHGFRQLENKLPKQYNFMNLNAVFFPSGDYSGFYEGMSNVNQFRIILNSLFNQKLPLLKDSTVFLTEPTTDVPNN
jgi:hypothetical protein